MADTAEILPPSTITLEEEMKTSYMDYAMSVIVSRALPDVRDGLKPVHRRILYAMKDGGYTNDKPFRKSARIVGDVMGKYHPHGDSAIYDAMVRMAQDFSMRLPLVDKQGNFGSMDGDPPAAMRYTEARLAKSCDALLRDIDKETVDYVPNYDESTLEPSVLPAEYPNLLVNGAGGIAVGMATNIPPHNLGEVIDATLALINDPDLTIADLTEHVQGPDFPTGAEILGRQGIASAYATGRGSVIMRAKTHLEEPSKGRTAIIVDEVPYQTNKERLMQRIAQAHHEKLIEGISELRDESNREGVRIVIELRRDAEPEVVKAQLFRHTPLQSSFGCNMLALTHGRPKQLNLKEILEAFIEFREVVITRRTAFDLRKARQRAHLLCGLAVAVANIDEVINLIRAAKDPEEAKAGLLGKEWPATDIGPILQKVESLENIPSTYRLSEEQAKAILDLRLQRLTGLEREKITDELDELVEKIKELLGILSNRDTMLDVMRTELLDMKEKFATPRRTTIEDNEFEMDIEELIQREDMIVTVSFNGYIKRVPLSTYRTQKRGGKGRAGMATRDDDFVMRVFVANTHTPVLFFTTSGKVYEMKVYKLPMGSPTALGKPMINLLPLEPGESISAVMPLPDDEENWENMFVMFATSAGGVRRNALSDFTNIRANGKIAMKLEESGERLIAVASCEESQDIMLSARKGKCIRFPVSDVRVFASRNSTGVRGIKLAKGDELISMSVINHVDIDVETRDQYLRGDLDETKTKELADQEQFIMTVSAKGYAKRTSAYEYRTAGRGGQGVTNMSLSKKTGDVVKSFPVENEDEVVVVTNGGQLIRCPVRNIRIAGRSTQGVILFKTAADEHVVSVAHLAERDEDEEMTSTEESQGESEAPEAPETSETATDESESQET